MSRRQKVTASVPFCLLSCPYQRLTKAMLFRPHLLQSLWKNGPPCSSLEEAEKSPWSIGLGERPEWKMPCCPQIRPHKHWQLSLSYWAQFPVPDSLFPQIEFSHKLPLSSNQKASAGLTPTGCRKFQTCLHLPHTQALTEVCTRCPDTLRHSPHTDIHTHPNTHHISKLNCKKKERETDNVCFMVNIIYQIQ